MKVYLACSIKGGRGLVDSYRQIVDALDSLGFVVQNAHIADADPTVGEGSPSEVFERDRAWIRTADVLVAEVSNPSIGVGYEIAFALYSGKQVLCLYREDFDIDRLSFMIAGNTEPNLSLRRYGPSNVRDVLAGSLA